MSFYKCNSGGAGGGGYANFPLIEGKIGKTTTPQGYDPNGYAIDGTLHEETIYTGNLIGGPFYSLLLDTRKIGSFNAILIGAKNGSTRFCLVISEYDDTTGTWSNVISPIWVQNNSYDTYTLPQDKLIQISMTNTLGSAIIQWQLKTQ